MFYNNEDILIKENIRHNFDVKNDKKFYANAQEFVCIKGSTPGYVPPREGDTCNTNVHSMNSNSFFSIIDGSVKIIGLYDGHGDVGHLVSSAAMGIMLDYLRNKNDVFKTKYIHQAKQEEILHEIKKAFKYTQMVLREDFQLMRRVRKRKQE